MDELKEPLYDNLKSDQPVMNLRFEAIANTLQRQPGFFTTSQNMQKVIILISSNFHVHITVSDQQLDKKMELAKALGATSFLTKQTGVGKNSKNTKVQQFSSGEFKKIRNPKLLFNCVEIDDIYQSPAKKVTQYYFLNNFNQI